MAQTMLTLVTGGCGFIGSHLVEELVGRDRKVRVLDDLSSGYLDNIEPFGSSVEFVNGDVRDARCLGDVMQGVREVFHEAALVSVFDSVERPEENHAINITGTLNVLEAARRAGVRRVVVASSAAVYGNAPELPKTETMLPQPESPYALAKIAKEYYMSVYHKLYGLETVSLRYFNVYGPRQDPSSMYSGVISKFVDQMLSGGTPTIFGDGRQSRDFVFVKDVVQANMLAMQSEAVGRGEVFNVATQERTSLLELVDTLARLLGVRAQPCFAEARAGDVRHSLADITRAREALGFAPRYSMEAGLRLLIEEVRGSTS